MLIPAPRHNPDKSGCALEFRQNRTGTRPLRLTLSPEGGWLWPSGRSSPVSRRIRKFSAGDRPLWTKPARRRADGRSRPAVARPPSSVAPGRPSAQSPCAPAPASSPAPPGGRPDRPANRRRRPKSRPPACAAHKASGAAIADRGPVGADRRSRPAVAGPPPTGRGRFVGPDRPCRTVGALPIRRLPDPPPALRACPPAFSSSVVSDSVPHAQSHRLHH